VLTPVIFLFAFLSFFIICFKIIIKVFVFSKASIKSVFNIVIDSAWHESLNLNPFVSKRFMKFHQLKVFSNRPFFFIQVWINIIIPPFSTLLSNSAWQKCSDLFPFLEAKVSNFLFKNHVFLWSPVTFDLLNSSIFSIIP
jgi:hypothetical protein